MNNLLDAVLIEGLNYGTVVFIGFVFISAILCFSIFLFKKDRNVLEERDENEPDFMDSCRKCSHENDECMEHESCVCSGSCSDINEEKEEIKDKEINEIISEMEDKKEENLEELEIPVKEKYNINNITRTVLIDCLKKAGVKGITRLSRADLILKFQELGLEYPEKL